MALRAIDLPGADLRFDAQAIAPARATALFDALFAEITWQVQHLRLFGRTIESPRRACWIGDADAVYTYSRTRFEPQPWTPTTAILRDELAACTGVRFNSVLANLYRDGHDAMGWHSDDEPELGPEPLIASLSFGATRRFRLRHRHDRDAPALTLDLGHGSLLLMAGTTQRNYRHALPRSTRVTGARINLTFRRIVAAAER